MKLGTHANTLTIVLMLLITGLAEGVAADDACLIRHFHYSPFGGFARTAAYAGGVAEGNIELLPKGGFDVIAN